MLWIIFAVFGVVLLGSVALTGAMYFRQERNAQNSATSLADGQFNTTSLQIANDVLGVAVGFNDFEPGKGLNLELDFIPAKNLADPEIDGAPTKPVCFSYQNINIKFGNESSMTTQNINIGLSGDVNWYPFDRYTGELWFYAFTSQDGDCSNPLPILPTVFGSLQGFSVDTSYEPDTVNGVEFAYVSLKFTAKRTAVTMGFAILLFIVMWCLTTSIVILTLWIWITGRRTELPIIVLSTALLYALPNIRNGSPGVPVRAGIIADLVGYIWHVLLVSMCVISLIVNYIYRKDGKKPKKIDKESIVKMGVLNV
jgi:hypothetical protein